MRKTLRKMVNYYILHHGKSLFCSAFDVSSGEILWQNLLVLTPCSLPLLQGLPQNLEVCVNYHDHRIHQIHNSVAFGPAAHGGQQIQESPHELWAKKEKLLFWGAGTWWKRRFCCGSAKDGVYPANANSNRNVWSQHLPTCWYPTFSCSWTSCKTAWGGSPSWENSHFSWSDAAQIVTALSHCRPSTSSSMPKRPVQHELNRVQVCLDMQNADWKQLLRISVKHPSASFSCTGRPMLARKAGPKALRRFTRLSSFNSRLLPPFNTV